MGGPEAAKASERKKDAPESEGSPFAVMAPLSDLRTVTVPRDSIERALGKEEYARRFNFSPERVGELLKEAGLPDELVTRLCSKINEHRETEAFKSLVETSPPGRRLITADCPERSMPKEVFEVLGCALFYTALLSDEKALAEELCRFFKEGKSGLQSLDVSGFSSKLEEVFSRKSKSDLAYVLPLLRAEYAGGNRLEQTFLLRGLLSPCFEAAGAAEPSNGVAGAFVRLLNALCIPPRQLRDLSDERLSRREMRLLNSLVKGGMGVDPKLRWAINELSGIQSLDAVQKFLEATTEISVPELVYILNYLPRGVNWGERENHPLVRTIITEMQDMGHYTENFDGFLGADIIIVNKALELCNGRGSTTGTRSMGGNLGKIVNQSCTRTMRDSSVRGDFRISLYDYLEAKMKEVMARILKEMT